jgi:hypothetical protein
MYRVHVVCEGPTDMVVVEAALETHLEDFVSQQIQPEQSLFGGDQGPLGGGWKGVRSWCGQIREQGGLKASGALANADLLVVHLDADVADDDEVACACPCPPPSATVDALQEVVLSWLGEDEILPKVVFCMPSKSTEAWILAGLHPEDGAVVPCHPPPGDDWTCLECRPEPAARLVGKPGKLVRRKQGQLKKSRVAYKNVAEDLVRVWPQILELCTQAKRFDKALKHATIGEAPGNVPTG